MPTTERGNTTQIGGRRWRLILNPSIIIIFLTLLSCRLTLAIATIDNKSAHHSGDELTLEARYYVRGLRRLQIPGIFDLSAGGMNPNANTNENEEDTKLDNSDIETTVTTTTDPPTTGGNTSEAAAIIESVPTPTITTTTTETSSPTIAPSPTPEISATYTSSGRNPTTPYPTQPIDVLDLPATVDVEECRKHLRVANADRNNWLNEAEYIEFVHQIVAAHKENGNNGGDDASVVWGTTMEGMPPAIQILYKNLNQGGAIEIVGYKVDPSAKPTRIEELFLIKVCVHTEVVVNHILQESAVHGGTPQTAYSVPDDEVVSVYSSFQLSNKVGLTSSNLQQDSGTNRDGLERAYRKLITNVVSSKVGQELSGFLEDQQKERSSQTNHRQKRRRQLTVTVDPRLPEIYRIDDTPCPGQQGADSTTIQTEWCQTAYGSFTLFLVGQDQLEVYDEFSQAVQTATSEGQMQTILEQVEPASEVRVTDAGARILPPPPTHSPTPVPVPAPTVEGHNSITVPEEQLTITKVEEDDSKHENMEMILVLAGILMTVNCCIISVSVYLCWKNRNNADIDLGVYDDDPSINDAYYDNLRANRKSRMTKKRRKSDASNSIRSMDSAPPTMDDILDSQTHYPAPSPAPMPFPHPDDAQARERILRGQGTSSISNISASSSSAAAPTKEEIEDTLRRSATAGSSTAQSVTSARDRSVRFEDETETEYTETFPVNTGEMA